MLLYFVGPALVLEGGSRPARFLVDEGAMPVGVGAVRFYKDGPVKVFEGVLVLAYHAVERAPVKVQLVVAGVYTDGF